MPEKFDIEVVFATPDLQELIEVEVEAGTTVQQAIDQSAIAERFPGVDLDSSPVGIWGREARREEEVRRGDRVEIYRGLEIEPREARRLLAES